MEIKIWEQCRTVVFAGLSLVCHMEQQLDDKELALLIEGWCIWASRYLQAMIQEEVRPDTLIHRIFAEFNVICLAQNDWRYIEAWRRVMDVYNSLIAQDGEN